MLKKYYTDSDIATLMLISLSRLRAKLSANEPLPPRIEIPESRTRLWDVDDVHDWFNSLKKQSDLTVSSPSSSRKANRGKK